MTSYAASPAAADSGFQIFQEADSFQEDQHSHPLYFEDASSSYYYQVKFEDYPPVSRFISGSTANFVDSSNHKSNLNLWTFSPDLRDSLENQIFPFHFFW